MRPGIPTSPGEYAEVKRRQAIAFLFPLGQPPQIPSKIQQFETPRQPVLADRVELLRQNRCVYFFRTPAPVTVDWYENPFEHQRSDAAAHFSDLPDFLPEQGDARTLWEPSRAAWAIDCAKASATGEYADIADIYWRWVDSWMDNCPPYQGFHWKCGQESAVRLIAILLGFWAVADDPTTEVERFRQMARLAWATGFRIYHHINYAISQKNNHAISEAVGLMFISHLFPEFRAAPLWELRGRRVLENEIRRQVYEDGSYVQHSMNYQRVMMQGAVLGLRLAELAGKPLGQPTYDSLGRCADFMFEMLDIATGQAPMYGNNDGAYLLPFSECDFLDFRPIVQTAHYAVHHQRRLSNGPWDEDLIWLFGDEAVANESKPLKQPASRAFEDGGYYTLRQAHSWCMLRCHTYRDRPGHYDQLQLDLWWRGINVFRDCGTFQYYIPDRADLEYYFKSIRSHNTVEIDGQDPVELASWFLWFPWPRGVMRRYVLQPGSDREDTQAMFYLEAEHYDYDRSPWHLLHRRSVIGLTGDSWVIVDDLLGTQKRQAVLRWHMADVPFTLDAPRQRVVLRTHAGEINVCLSVFPQVECDLSVIRGRDTKDQIQGLASSYYGKYEPIPTLEAAVGIDGTQRIVTAIGPQVTAVMRSQRPEPRASKTENWIVELQDRSCRLRLALPERSAKRICLGQTAIQKGVDVR